MSCQSTQPLIFDPLHPDFTANPRPFFTALRRGGPYYYAPLDMWMLSRYEDVTRIAVHPKMLRSLKDFVPEDQYREMQRRMKFDDMPFHERLVQSNLLDMDGPAHQALRWMVFGWFTKAAAVRQQGSISALADRYLDRIPSGKSFDFIQTITATFPGYVVGAFIGVPDDDVEMLGACSEDIVRYYDIDKTLDGKAKAEAAAQKFYHYFKAINRAEMAPNPQSLIGMLKSQAQDAGINEDDFISLAMLIFMAGWGSTGDVMGSGLHLLMTHPEALKRLKADASLMPTAVQEILRYETPLPFFHRHALEDINLAGRDFKAGTTFGLLYGAANHDPKAIKNPDVFDIARRPNRHLSFGHGAHLCLGNQLARLSLGTMFSKLLLRFNEFASVDKHVIYKSGLSARGPKILNVILR